MSECCNECGRPILPTVYGKGVVTGPFETREELRDAVLTLLASGDTVSAIAARFALSISTISRIKHGDKTSTINGYRVPLRGLYRLYRPNTVQDDVEAV